MKFRFILLLLLCICIPFFSLSESANVKTILVNELGLNDDEKLEGFIDYYSITEDNIGSLNIYYLYDEYVSRENWSPYSIDSLLYDESNVSTNQFTPGNTDRVLVLLNMGSDIRIEVYDLSGGKHYIGTGAALHNMNSSLSYPLSRGEFSNKLEAMLQAGVLNWESEYNGGQTDTTAWTSWLIALEDKNNNVIRFTGSGSATDTFPDGLESVLKALITPYDSVRYSLEATSHGNEDRQILNFIKRMYSELLGRQPDLTGENIWCENILENEGTVFSVANGFLSSDEYKDRNKNNQERVESFYRAFLERSPGGNEEKDWVNYLNQGVSDLFIVKGLLQSSEFAGKSEKIGIPAGSMTLTEPRDQDPKITWYVTRCYQYALNRNPDIDGLNSWCSSILNNEIGYDDVARDLLLSQEMMNRQLDSYNIVTLLYRLFLNREPDSAGLNHWMSQLSNGMPLSEVIDGFINTEEHRNALENMLSNL